VRGRFGGVGAAPTDTMSADSGTLNRTSTTRTRALTPIFFRSSTCCSKDNPQISVSTKSAPGSSAAGRG
jgi:hypothetical protein